ncbi:hypothetical protein ACLOJK_010611 [Asimina triloba]
MGNVELEAAAMKRRLTILIRDHGKDDALELIADNSEPDQSVRLLVERGYKHDEGDEL